MSSCDGNSGGGGGGGTGTGSNPGGTGGTQGCQHCTISSETFATIPSNRARTRIGIGEDVTLTVTPGPAQWSVSGDAVLNPTSGSVVTFRAGSTAGSVTVTAQGPGCTCNITFTVVEPEALYMGQQPDSVTRHVNNHPCSGFLGMPSLYPYDVNFYNVEVREQNSAATTNGYYASKSGVTHMPAGTQYSSWLSIDEQQHGIMSVVNGWDKIWSGWCPGVATAAGTMTFPITWQFRCWGSSPKALRAFQQSHVCDTAGAVTTSKGGTTVSAAYADPTSAADARWN